MEKYSKFKQHDGQTLNLGQIETTALIEKSNLVNKTVLQLEIFVSFWETPDLSRQNAPF